jgi:hypothetical protein
MLLDQSEPDATDIGARDPETIGFAPKYGQNVL